jgi:ABC-type arginine transport system permease subunit
MVGSSRVRKVVLLLLVAVLLLPPLARAKENRARERTSPRQSFTTLWRAVPEVWTLFKSIWEKEGSSLDPFGQPKPNEGSSLDPFGGK